MKDIRETKQPRYENLGTKETPLWRYYFRHEFIAETEEFPEHWEAEYLPISGGDHSKPSIAILEQMLQKEELETREILTILRQWQKCSHVTG